MLILAVNNQALLDLHIHFSTLCNQYRITARIFKPGEPQIVQDLDVPFLLQVLRVELGEGVCLVHELDEFRREFSIIVLAYVIYAAVVAFTEESVILAEFTISA